MKVTVATRDPLYLTKSEATNWFSLHSEDAGREIVIRENPIHMLTADELGKPVRSALGWNAAGVWEWL